MVRVIRNLSTGQYLTKGEWTPNYDDAQKFDGTADVVRTCLALALTDVEMVMTFDPDRSAIRVRIPDP